VTWINIDGLKDKAKLEKICKHFNLHPLVIEDILHTEQRPKVEDYDDYLYIVVRMLDFDEKKNHIKSEQISVVLGPACVISFQERDGDTFTAVRERIRKDKGKVRRMGPDFLAYSLLDTIVDRYFVILERLGERIESMEEAMIRSPSPKILHQIHRLKRELVTLRKSVWPLREVVNALERETRSKSPLIKKGMQFYLRDLYDHTIQVIDTVETYRDVSSGMLDIYLSSVSNRMNEIMKVLTVIGTIFIPLTFVTGWYGMNFLFMPELHHPLGYPAVLLFMALVAVTMLLTFGLLFLSVLGALVYILVPPLLSAFAGVEDACLFESDVTQYEGSVREALSDLCDASRAFIGASIMIAILIGGFFSVINFILSIIDVIQSKYDTSKKAAWILAFIIFQILACTIYYVIEKRKSNGKKIP
jgi:magnesium transporter